MLPADVADVEVAGCKWLMAGKGSVPRAAGIKLPRRINGKSCIALHILICLLERNHATSTTGLGIICSQRPVQLRRAP